MDTILTNFANDVDVWMSVYIGAGFAVGIIGVAHAIRSFRAAHREKKMSSFSDVPKGRGDFPLWLAFVGYGFRRLPWSPCARFT